MMMIFFFFSQNFVSKGNIRHRNIYWMLVSMSGVYLAIITAKAADKRLSGYNITIFLIKTIETNSCILTCFKLIQEKVLDT